mmetsp:Transcript_52847/g.113236  ORF Transcript_52847/g.113236 Transcript_52847/m.113236 type:complete len:542 (-) Transcript_52847:74-1699(-)
MAAEGFGADEQRHDRGSDYAPGRPSEAASRRSSRGMHQFAEGPEPLKHASAYAEGAEPHAIHECLLAEFVGTFSLVLTICVAVAGKSPFASISIGLVLAIQIYTFGSVSGGLFNPAVTLAVLIAGRGKICLKRAALYILFQFIGAFCGALVAFGTTQATFCFDYALTPKGGAGTSFFLELLYTAALAGTVLAAGTSFDAPNDYFGFAIGGVVMAAASACGPFDQGSFNPAVTFGINIVNYFHSNSVQNPDFGAWVVFLLAPLGGGLLAAAIFRGTRSREYMDLELAYALQQPVLLREKLLAEFVGTFFLVLTVSVAVASSTFLAPVAIGVILSVQIYTYASVSGGLFNPAVTLAVLLSGRGKMSVPDALAYMGVQCLGATAAGAIGYGLTDASFFFAYEANSDGNAGTSILLEIFYTGALSGAVLSTGTSWDAPNQYFGFAIGGTVLAGAFACGGFDQGSFNPAVTWGINIAHYMDSDASDTNPSFVNWVYYLTAPLAGGIFAAGIFAGTRWKEIQGIADRESTSQVPPKTIGQPRVLDTE